MAPPDVPSGRPFMTRYRRPDGTGYSAPECACPRCNGPAIRVPRRFVDLLISMFITVSRFRCSSTDCGWEGNLRVKRHPWLMQGPG
jgi:hypothetical protein